VRSTSRAPLIFDARDRFRVIEFDLAGRPEMGRDGKVAALLSQKLGDRQRRAARVR
jgi:hypothetical protein